LRGEYLVGDSHHTIEDKSMTLGSAVSPVDGRAKHWVVRVAGAALLVIATAIHVYEYFGASPVSLAALFIASAAGTAVGAGLLLANVPRWGWLIGGGASLLTFAGYCVARTVGIPVVDPSGDIGNWLEPLGVVSLVVEAGAVLLAVIALASLTPRRVQDSPSPAATSRMLAMGWMGRRFR
jgi:hypothetical protein